MTAGGRMTPVLRIPFTVIGGFLGAGKTTLVNHLLLNPRGMRLAVLVNDFGAVNIDADLIERHEGDTVSLTNGCICCGLSAGLVEVLPGLLSRDPPFDHIVVEASGVADPRKVAQYGTTPGFRLDGVIVLADAETIRANAADPRIGEQVLGQLRAADLLVLTKGDLVGSAQLEETREWLRHEGGGAPVLDAIEGCVSPEVILGQRLEPRAIGPSGDPGDSADTHHFETRTYAADSALDRGSLERFAQALPRAVLRAKGILHLTDSPRRTTVLHVVGTRVRLTDGDGAVGGSRLVVIGLGGGLVALGAASLDEQAAAIGLQRLS